MVSRREKLKLLQSKAQEQMFNLHVTLMNKEFSAGEKFITLLCSVCSNCIEPLESQLRLVCLSVS